MQFWEYKVVDGLADTIEKELNKLGKLTWEVVGVSPAPGGKVVCVLKREVRTAPNAAKIDVATREDTGPYIPGTPQGTEG